MSVGVASQSSDWRLSIGWLAMNEIFDERFDLGMNSTTVTFGGCAPKHFGALSWLLPAGRD
jgi:hypothetical protein